MRQDFGQCHGALLLLHGGAGPQDAKGDGMRQATNELKAIAEAGLLRLAAGQDPLDCVVDCLKAMEASERFNAGRGAALQADLGARLTAAVMDSRRQEFSGVISVSYVEHPSVLARHLQGASARVLTNPGAELLARKLNLPLADNVTSGRLASWTKRFEQGESLASMDTVGCVIRASDGTLYVGTSTGGRGFEFPGRVSDSATVAGTYCSEHCAVGATGIGEQIVDAALCARIETRRRDGMSLEEASRRCFDEALARGHKYGWIAADKEGAWCAVTTTEAMSFVVMNDERGLVASSYPD